MDLNEFAGITKQSPLSSKVLKSLIFDLPSLDIGFMDIFIEHDINRFFQVSHMKILIFLL